MRIDVVEFILVAVAYGIALWKTELGRAPWCRVERGWSWLAQRRVLAVWIVVFVAFVGRAALLPVSPFPEPQVHDEFSYLLAADTYAHGRLANPTHPMWVHFESPHISHQPTYMSMYPPGQGLMLAFGKVLLGHPWWGVCLSTSLMCGALVWMLQGWIPSKWALLGGLVAVIRIQLFSYWGNSYWGGSLAAIGGLLALGALPRMARRRQWTDAACMGSGFSILGLARPYEGLVLAAAVSAALIYLHSKREPVPRGPLLKSSSVLAFIGPLALAGSFLLYHNWRVYGGPFRLPYTTTRAQYAAAGVFLWQSPRPEPLYRHAVLRNFYIGWELYHFKLARTAKGFLRLFARRLLELWAFYVGPVLMPFLLAGAAVFAGRRSGRLLPISLAFAAGLLLEAWFSPHYAAPAMGILYAMMLEGGRSLCTWRYRGRRVGQQWFRWLMFTCVLMLGVRALSKQLGVGTEQGAASWASAIDNGIRHDSLQHELAADGGKHLIVVRYRQDHNPNQEWVYNSADIDNAAVVWAREMGSEDNKKFFRYFRDRRTWLLEPDCAGAGIVPYPYPSDAEPPTAPSQ